MGENLPGGKEIIYMSDCLVRLEQKARLKKDAEFFIEGFISEGTLLKSRSNASGIQVPFIFEQRTGIDNILTNYLYLKNNGLIVGGGRGGFCLKDYPDYKFSQKDIRDMYKSNKGFRKAFDTVSKEAMIGLLTKFQAMDQDNNIPDEEVTEEREEITPEALSKMNLKHLKEACKQYGVDVDWRDYDVNNYKELRQTLVDEFDTYFK